MNNYTLIQNEAELEKWFEDNLIDQREQPTEFPCFGAVMQDSDETYMPDYLTRSELEKMLAQLTPKTAQA